MGPYGSNSGPYPLDSRTVLHGVQGLLRDPAPLPLSLTPHWPVLEGRCCMTLPCSLTPTHLIHRRRLLTSSGVKLKRWGSLAAMSTTPSRLSSCDGRIEQLLPSTFYNRIGLHTMHGAGQKGAPLLTASCSHLPQPSLSFSGQDLSRVIHEIVTYAVGAH